VLRIVTVTVLLGGVVFAQSSGPELSAIADGETAFYNGKIDGRFGIALSLTRNGGNISGSYQYASQGKAIDLQGTVLPDAKLKIEENAAPSVASGEFLVGAAPGQSELTGEWRSADGKHSYAVHLQRIDTDRFRELLTQWRARRELKSKPTPTKQKTLFDRLTSPDPSDQVRRSQAVQEVRALDPVRLQQIISELMEALAGASKGNAESEWRGNFAAQSLGELGEPAVAPLLKALHGSDAGVRARAASALGTIGVPALRDVTGVLEEPSPELRCAAAHALAVMRANAAPAVPALTALLRNGSLEVQRCVVAALGAIGSKEALGELRSELRDTTLQGETLNALAMMQRRASDATPEVLSLMKIDKPLTRMIAVRTLGKIATPSPEVVAALTVSLSDADRITRETAVTSLGEMGPAAAPAVPLLRKFLHDHSDTGRWVRANAAETLGKIGPGAADATGDLIALWADEFLYARRNAVDAVSCIGPAAIPALMGALHDRQPDIRSGATWQLGVFHAAQATSPLIEALGDKDPTVQAAARQALDKIATPEAKEALAKAPSPPPVSELQTLAQVEGPVPAAGDQRSPMKLASKASLRGPGGISLLATVHRCDDCGDLVRIWKPVGDRFLVIYTPDSKEDEAEDPSVAAYEEPEGFRLSGEYFIHLMLLYSGTGFGHEDAFLWIGPDASLHKLKFVSPASQYALREGEGVWKGEMNLFRDDEATFRFGIWRDGDGNCCPTGGEVKGHYKLTGSKHYNPETKKWSADFQIVPADFTRLDTVER
jgi:HEAT repeat protein